MPFNGDEFSRLGLPPYSGALAAEFQNLADGLTTLKGETVIIDNETVKIAIGGMPGDGQVIKFDLATTSLGLARITTTLEWRAAGKRTYRSIGTSPTIPDLRRLRSEQAGRGRRYPMYDTIQTAEHCLAQT